MLILMFIKDMNFIVIVVDTYVDINGIENAYSKFNMISYVELM